MNSSTFYKNRKVLKTESQIGLVVCNVPFLIQNSAVLWYVYRREESEDNYGPKT